LAKVKRIKRLVTFGCSLTYGHGLADCYLPSGREGPKPSIQAWPKLVSDKLRIDVDNRGIPGGSNKEIWHSVMSSKFKEGDMVVILWSYINRNCIFFPDYIDRYGPWKGSVRSKKWFEHQFNDYDATVELMGRVNHVNLYLNKKKIRNYHYFADFYCSKQKVFPQYNTPEKMFLRQPLDFARDGQHPGAKSHVAFADQIFNDPTGPAVGFGFIN
jgi:lysophospholipase L1-like esterase